MNRPLLTLLLSVPLFVVALTGCHRQSDTNDPDKAPAARTEVVEDVTVDETVVDENTTTPSTTPTTPNPLDPGASNSDNALSDSDNVADPNSEGQLICTPEWFKWVNEKVSSIHSEDITEQYPTGLPEIGSDAWFTAVDMLTGGDGAHGPDGGSDEWCFMMQQRLNKKD